MKNDRKYYLIGLIAIVVVTAGAISLHKAGQQRTTDHDQTVSDVSLPPARIN